jgi:branched-chain amino acid transport system ATP-binding protein
MTAILTLQSLSKHYGAIVVADGINLAIPEGQALGIIGPNGAGKTSLFGMIAGNVKADAGVVTFAGVDITRYSPSQRCRLGIARSFQIPQPFGGMSVFENLLVAARMGAGLNQADANALCADTLERCGLADLANRKAKSLTLLQRKRLELGRALASKPKLLLLDEVAGGLTEDECRSLVALVRSVRQSGVTIVWIEHIVHALIAVVDRLVVLHGGVLIADGDPEAVIRSPQVAEIYMGIPADV